MVMRDWLFIQNSTFWQFKYNTNSTTMRLDIFELDKKLSVAEMKHVKAGSVNTCSGGKHICTNVGLDVDRGGRCDDANAMGF